MNKVDDDLLRTYVWQLAEVGRYLDDAKRLQASGLRAKVVSLFHQVRQFDDADLEQFEFLVGLNSILKGGSLHKGNEAETQKAVARAVAKLKVKPRYVDRDAEIVRLRDVEGKSFGQIRLILRARPEWAKTQNGEAISVEAIKAAYGRCKRAAKPRNAGKLKPLAGPGGRYLENE